MFPWGSLLTVALVATGVAVTVVVLVAFAMLGLSARAPGPVGGEPRGPRSGVGTAVGVFCLIAAALIVAYGVVLVVG